jgi:hypothetical protein
MHKDRFKLYQRVRISGDCHWAQNATGMIAEPPTHMVEGYGDGVSRVVESSRGPIVFYFVQFDSPQYDADGDGPYPASEIDDRDIVTL